MIYYYNILLYDIILLLIHERFCIEKYFEYGRKKINSYGSIDFMYIFFYRLGYVGCTILEILWRIEGGF